MFSSAHRCESENFLKYWIAGGKKNQTLLRKGRTGHALMLNFKQKVLIIFVHLQIQVGSETLPCKGRCSLSHVQANAQKASLTPPHSPSCVLLSYQCIVHAQGSGGTIQDVARQADLEVWPRRSGGPLGQEKLFPPSWGERMREQQCRLWRIVLVVSGRMLSAERNSQNVVL